MTQTGKWLLSLAAVLTVLALSACSGEETATPDEASNAPPSVSAAAKLDQQVTLPLQGNVSDNTLPTGRLSMEWNKISGPGPVSFADRHSADTTATFSVAGTYVLRLTATDGEFTMSDDITVTVEQ